MQRLVRFLNNLDARAARAIGACLAMFALVAAVYVLGKTVLGVGDELALEAWLEGVAQSPWALPATVLAFTALAFLGAPQFLLIAAAVVAFGPWNGAVYSWIGSMVAAAVTFWLGRTAGAGATRRYGGARLARFSRFVGRNGFWTALAIRNVPSAPFIVVNMGLGMSHSRFSHYMAGTGLGIIPKIALVAFAGRGLMEVLLRAASWEAAALAGLGALVWLGGMLVSRRLLRRGQTGTSGEDAARGP